MRRDRLSWTTSLATIAALVMASAPTSAAARATRPAAAPASPATLEDGFRDPPNSARPRVWWHWMSGNVTEEGIRHDIEWMARVGIGGLQNFDASLNVPQIVDRRLVYMTPEWRHAFRYAAHQADLHHLELAIAASPGWSETGGPWVQPQDAIKKLVWSDTIIVGGRRFAGALPPLPDNAGPFQDLPVQRSGMSALDAALPIAPFARPVAVLAVRVPDAAPPLPRIVSGSGQVLDAAALADGRFAAAQTVQRPTGGGAPVLTITYDTPQAIRALTLCLPGAGGGFTGPLLAPELESSADGVTWTRIADVPLTGVPTTISFPTVTARLFRVTLNRPHGAGNPMARLGQTAPGVDLMGMMSVFGGNAASMAAAMNPPLAVSELSLSAEPRVNAFELKAGFALTDDYYALDHGADAAAGVAPRDVINLTDRVGSDGRLDWTPPPGRWRVLRFGYSLIGTTNHPATPEATGLEVDKYDGHAVRGYIDHYLGMYRDTVGNDLIGAHGLRAMLTDSIEVGASNWTPDMIAQFRRLRGYDPTPWLPTLAGVLVGTRAQSDAFLYDFRRTLADLIASQHYGTLAEAAHANGLTYYSESLEGNRVSLGDDMSMRAPADVPMAAMWTYSPDNGPRPAHLLDMRGAASVAHLYGQNLVAAESLTSMLQPWAYAPSDLQPMIDMEFVSGINRPVIHTSVHQPRDDRQPGLALQIFGQYFNRHESWAEMARPWVTYMARSSFLLQQGRAANDVAYFYGEEAPLAGLYNGGLPADAPTRYGYDFVSPDALRDVLSVQGGEIVARGGARYRVLYLGGSSSRMTLPTLRRIAALAEAGATIVGDAPTGSPALGDDPAAYAALVRRLWAGGASTAVGAGRVIAGHDIEGALTAGGTGPDFVFAGAPADTHVLFAHRRLADGDLYFLTNRDRVVRSGEARFRVTGRVPELWRADSGERRPVSYRTDGGTTVVPLTMAAQDSFFLVFRRPTTLRRATVATPQAHQIADIGAGAWDVTFQPGRGAPAAARLPALASLSENADPGIRYFSGVASYRRTFTVPVGAGAGQPLLLDLGRFGDVAEVWVNGRQVGTVWREPHRIDIGGFVHPGSNELEVRVADLWVNRLIGDAQPGATRIAFTSTPTYTAHAPLRPSGLIGPVTLWTQR